IAPAGTRRQASGPVRARFYLPAAAGIVVLVSALMLTRRVPRWAGGYLLYGTQPTGARANQAATHGSLSLVWPLGTRGGGRFWSVVQANGSA
nr:hypothetical protein [Actinomycetota bacterium]